MKLKDFKKELLKNPELRKEFERYDLAFEISQMLIEARIIKGITQVKLAEMIKTKQSGIARAERGTVLPKLSFLKKIADAFRTQLIVRFAFMEKLDMKVIANNSATQPRKFVYAVTSQSTPAYIAYDHSSRQGGFIA